MDQHQINATACSQKLPAAQGTRGVTLPAFIPTGCQPGRQMWVRYGDLRRFSTPRY